MESGKSFSKKVFYYLLFQQEELVHKLTTFFEKLSQNVKKSTSWFSRLTQLFKVGKEPIVYRRFFGAKNLEVPAGTLSTGYEIGSCNCYGI